MAMQLSGDEVVHFLKVIGVSLEDGLILDKAAFLKQIITAFSQHIPFTNLNLLLIPKDERCVPTWDNIKKKIISRQGGMCYELNTFMCALLSGLGFRAYCTVALVLKDDYPSHVVVIVKDLQKIGDTFLVDVGCGRPAFDSFPLDFEVESMAYQHNYVTCKYAKVGDRYVCQQIVMKTDSGFEEAQWVDAYSFNLDAFSLDELAAMLNKSVYLYNADEALHHGVRAFFSLPGMSRGFKATADGVIVYEADSGEKFLRNRIVNSAAELKTFVGEYFPFFSWSTLEYVLNEEQ